MISASSQKATSPLWTNHHNPICSATQISRTGYHRLRPHHRRTSNGSSSPLSTVSIISNTIVLTLHQVHESINIIFLQNFRVKSNRTGHQFSLRRPSVFLFFHSFILFFFFLIICCKTYPSRRSRSIALKKKIPHRGWNGRRLASQGWDPHS